MLIMMKHILISRFWHSPVSNIQGHCSVSEADNVHHLPHDLDTVLGRGPVAPLMDYKIFGPKGQLMDQRPNQQPSAGARMKGP